MTDAQTAVTRYLDMWNETDAAKRRAVVEEVCTPDVRYVDPLAAVTGHDGLNGLIGAAQQQFPGLTFTPGGAADAHHQQARFTWHLGQPGGEPLAIGFDVVEFAPDGRIATVLGFLDKVPG
ncbi:nuclear transport factor 2 family protein [Virgisporangium ochraceum]|nr:nuclear transport factor 2 family protein [Virgisporangium ochraceum]